ncbi:fungal specific transcription factor [Colletotrichum lupini]|uniref:Fungal specific transcription factor n=1 Tax=Colletotrichum lupini TaxID=145971 RepID=A0A9Q8WL97_9PEZI|nr:fungal specific transcription factor [Colletotrichum lupini]UQC87549.1 fungal specific transcription factor [Colletotrichum lupini]
MRSNIACQRCRKRKIKCDNADTSFNTPCNACIRTGHVCDHPEAATRSGKRAAPKPTSEDERVGQPGSKMVKKPKHVFWLDETNVLEEVLSMPCLSRKLWFELFDLYQLHFAAELPFMHLPTLKSIVHDKEAQAPSTDAKLALLAILTLTARLHPDLVRFVSHRNLVEIEGSKRHNPLLGTGSFAASEYFADRLIGALGPLECALTKGSVARIQVFLTLSRYRWSQPDGGPAAWMYLGVAIRMAQGLGLNAGGKHLKIQRTELATKSPKATHLSPNSRTEQEINRRTMFSCLILDCFLSAGHGRVSTMSLGGLQIQLPSDEYSFNVGRPSGVHCHPDAALLSYNHIACENTSGAYCNYLPF